jgi:hypothetical protein
MNANNQKKPPHSPAHARQQRLRALSRLLDSAFPLPGGYRIGLDGIIGLIPGIGDISGTVASSYIIVESARLGASTGTLLRMVFNVLVDSLFGLVPFIGDLFDVVWKANEKNMVLLEKQLEAAPPASSPETRLKSAVFIVLFLMLAGVAAIAYFGFMVLLRLIAAMQGAGGG